MESAEDLRRLQISWTETRRSQPRRRAIRSGARSRPSSKLSQHCAISMMTSSRHSSRPCVAQREPEAKGISP